jgi:hypothetical protein
MMALQNTTNNIKNQSYNACLFKAQVDKSLLSSKIQKIDMQGIEFSL